MCFTPYYSQVPLLIFFADGPAVRNHCKSFQGRLEGFQIMNEKKNKTAVTQLKKREMKRAKMFLPLRREDNFNYGPNPKYELTDCSPFQFVYCLHTHAKNPIPK